MIHPSKMDEIWGTRTYVSIDLFLLFLDMLKKNKPFREKVFSIAKLRPSELKKPIDSAIQQSWMAWLTNVNHNTAYTIDLLQETSSTPISNQTQKQLCVGSETRDFDFERIQKLHEYMTKLREILYAQLTPIEQEKADKIAKNEAENHQILKKFVEHFI